MEIIRKVYCPLCGTQTLTAENYSEQLDQADIGWLCPRCGGSAVWQGEYHPCLDPDCCGMACVETDQCDTCGRYQCEIVACEDEDDD